RFRGTSGDRLRVAYLPGRIELRDKQYRAVPRHAGMLPGDPKQCATVGRQPWAPNEIVAADQNLAGIAARPGEIDGHDGVHCLATSRVVLAHADPAITIAIDDAVGKSPLTLAIAWSRCQRLGCSLPAHAVKAAIGEVREIDHAVSNGPRRAAIFVHARAGTETLRRQVRGGRARGIATHHHEAALLLRPALEPVTLVAIGAGLR